MLGWTHGWASHHCLRTSQPAACQPLPLGQQKKPATHAVVYRDACCVPRPAGSYQSAWNSGGGFITVQGSKQRSRNDDSRLSYIRGPGVVLRGSRVIPVSTLRA